MQAVSIAAVLLAALHPGGCSPLANPLLQQRVLGSEGRHHRVYHVEGDDGMVMADPKPRQYGGQCGAAACDDIPFPTPWSKVRAQPASALSFRFRGPQSVSR